MESGVTPMIKQYLEIKDQHKDAILFFRLGDFYEMFFDDALEATSILHITLTSRGSSGGRKIPMCGIPHHAANNYIVRLIKAGKKIAICEQVEEPCKEKKIVKREVVKIITPGTFIADDFLDAANNYIMSISPRGGNYGLAYADISTGEFNVTELDSAENLFSELYKISSRECLIPESFSKEEFFSEFKDVFSGSLTVNEDWQFDYDLSLEEIKHHFSVKNLDAFDCRNLPLASSAAGALLRYLKRTQKLPLNNISRISTYKVSQFMVLDESSCRHLELIQNNEDASKKGTLLEVLDHTRTSMGARHLKTWILNPLLDIEKITRRQNGVRYFYANDHFRENVRTVLSDIYDIERLSNKVSMGTCNARDMRTLSSSLKEIAKIKKEFQAEIPVSLKDIVQRLDDFSDVINRIEDCLVESPPLTLKEGALIKRGYDPAIDEVKDLLSNGKDALAALQKKEIERSGISSLKVGFTRVFGYYIEVTNANLKAVPENYVRKQTLTNAERFVTEELKEWESKIIGAEERSKNMEYEAFCGLREKCASEIERLKEASRLIGKIDVLASLAQSAVINRYCCPKVDSGDNLNITRARHPVIERVLKDKEFVPNDICMTGDTGKIFIITGSNMAGKSTFIRQTALISIMAQMGSFVPAKEAVVGVIDRVFTRVGASDRLYRGMSTFMVEMLETANILNNATGRSLIILDEVGRGTSTFDGVSIAWAVVEYISRYIPGAKTMFATHYHELTELTEITRGIKNYHLAVREWGEEIIFLYKIKEGGCDESFGIHVAKLAGMPQTVVKRAREILNNLQKDSFSGNIRFRFSEKKDKSEEHSDFFNKTEKERSLIDAIQKIDVDNLTPIEALKKIAELKKETG